MPGSLVIWSLHYDFWLFHVTVRAASQYGHWILRFHKKESSQLRELLVSMSLYCSKQMRKSKQKLPLQVGIECRGWDWRGCSGWGACTCPVSSPLGFSPWLWCSLGFCCGSISSDAQGLLLSYGILKIIPRSHARQVLYSCNHSGSQDCFYFILCEIPFLRSVSPYPIS